MFERIARGGGGLGGLALAGALALGFAATDEARAGTVTLVSVEQTVSASIRSGDDDQTDVRSSTDPMPFDDAAVVESVGDGFTYRASSSLVSTFDAAGLSFDFERRYETQDTRGGGPIQASVGFDVEVVFAIDEVHRGRFGTSRGDEATSTPGAGADGDAFFALVGTDGTDFFAFPDSDLLLEPGTYALQLIAGRTSNGGLPETESLFAPIRFDLSLTEADGAPNPIPLPPAVLGGAVLLGAGALNRLRKRR